MICICRRSGRSARCAQRRDVGAVEARCVPAVGSSSRSSVRPSVDLPQPDSPTRPSVSPAATSRSTAVDRAHRGRLAAADRPPAPAKCFGRGRSTATQRLAHARASSGKRQRTQRRARAGSSAGSSARHCVLRRAGSDRRTGSRPAARCSAGTMPGISAAARSHRRVVERRHRAQQARGVGVARRREQRRRPSRARRRGPAYITHDLVAGLGDDAEVVRDEQDRHAELALQLREQLEDLRLDRDVERGGRLVGDQQLGLARQRHRDHHALPHAARQLVRILVDALLGRRDADEPEHLDRVVARLGLRLASGAAAPPRRSARRR